MKLKIILVIDVLFLSFILVLKSFENIFTLYYKTGYTFISFVFSTITDIFHFSITEFFFTSLIIFFFIFFLRSITLLFKKKETLKIFLKEIVFYLFLSISIFFIWFYMVWGFNYFKESFFDRAEKDDAVISNDKLLEYAKILVKKLNSFLIPRSIDEKVLNNIIENEIKKVMKDRFRINIKTSNRIKHSFFNLLEKSNTSGVISPFFLEAHVSKELLDVEKAWVISHEKSHLFGVTDESDANIIAYIVCVNSDKDDLKFSAYFNLMLYFLSEVNTKCGKKVRDSLFNSLNKDIQLLIENRQKRYKKYDNLLTRSMLSIYNYYLKFNGIKNGISSYNAIVYYVIHNKLI